MKYYIGIDLGGTNIAAGVVDEDYKIVGKASVKTNLPRPANEICDDMAKAARMAAESAGISVEDVEWVGIGSPGTANTDTGILEYSNNLDFHNLPLKAEMENRLGKDVYIENDANAAAYGEAIAGAAKGKQNVVAVTIGTGIGGGVIINGKIYGGQYFAGAELGHMGIVYNGRQCTCGRKGCMEAYASATGLKNLTKETMEKYPDSKMWELTDGTVEKVSGRTAFDAMRLGDKAGKEVVDTYIEYLGYGLANFVNIFQPEILVIGGGVCNEGEALIAPLRDYIDNHTMAIGPEVNTKLMVAKLGNDAGIIGAAFLGRIKK